MKRSEMHQAYLDAVARGDRKREHAAVMAMLMDDLMYPPSVDDKAIMDLTFMRPGIARHLGRLGWRWHPDKALIKKRTVAGPGTFMDACVWVDVREPDDPLEDLQNMTMAQINSLPDELRVEAQRRLGILNQAEPQGDPWQAPNQVSVVDAPDVADDGAVWH